MDLPRVSRAIRRITILSRDENGSVVPVVVFDKGKKKKKGTRMFRPLEKLSRQLVEASNDVTGSYLSRHKKSNRKRRDGWIRDVNANVMRAGRKGWKTLAPSRLFNL